MQPWISSRIPNPARGHDEHRAKDATRPWDPPSDVEQHGAGDGSFGAVLHLIVPPPSACHPARMARHAKRCSQSRTMPLVLAGHLVQLVYTLLPNWRWESRR